MSNEEIKLNSCPECGDNTAIATKFQSDRWNNGYIKCNKCGYVKTLRNFINVALLPTLPRGVANLDWQINGSDVTKLTLGAIVTTQLQIDAIIRIKNELAPLFNTVEIQNNSPEFSRCGVCHNKTLVKSGLMMICRERHYAIYTRRYLVLILESLGYIVETDHGTEAEIRYRVYKDVDVKSGTIPIINFDLVKTHTKTVATLKLNHLGDEEKVENKLIFSKPADCDIDLYSELVLTLKSRYDSVFDVIEKKNK